MNLDHNLFLDCLQLEIFPHNQILEIYHHNSQTLTQYFPEHWYPSTANSANSINATCVHVYL